MTRKEQNKILDNKIKANNAQHNLDRMNAEISTYSSGNLFKYEYLTNKDLSYKPDEFEKAKFQNSSLGKVFTDGLNKSDRKEGLLKRLKNIESKSNNQSLALKNINKPAIRGRDNNNNNEDNDDDDDDHHHHHHHHHHHIIIIIIIIIIIMIFITNIKKLLKIIKITK